MLSRGGWLRLVFLLVTAGLAWGIYELFALRMEGGDAYPEYSTLRADPLGAKAFHDALAELPGWHVERNYKPLAKLRPAEPVTLLYLGLHSTARWEPGELEAFEEIVRGGGRAVFAFRSEQTESERPMRGTPRPKATPAERSAPAAKKKPDDKKSDGEEEDSPDAKRTLFGEAAQGWGVQFEMAQAKKRGAFEGKAERQSGVSGLEEDLPWHSALYFKTLKPDWRAIYRADLEPVVIERKMGQGTVVLMSDAFLVSNEAVHSAARAPQLLSWLIGPNRVVIFDEEHHGIREEPGIATLLRKYRLHWLLLALAILAGLFLWQQGAPFLPPPSDAAALEASVTGRSAGEGLRTLLRRGVPAGKLIETCLAEWRHAAEPRERARVEQAVAQFQEAPARERAPAAVYRAIVAALRHERGPGAGGKPAGARHTSGGSADADRPN